jgi:hypothetical protein
MHWAEDITFARFDDSQRKVIVGGFHLSSKTEIGQL